MSAAQERPAVTLTLDLEDHRSSPSQEKRYPRMTMRLLQWCEDYQIRMSVFTVGEIAADEPGLLRDIAQAGHEIACHSAAHVPLNEDTPENFREQTASARKQLQDCTGSEVKGFRAPVFSLGRSSLWAVDIIRELGFAYSSSVLPAANPLHGMAKAPQEPFLWPNELPELPVPVAGLGRVSLPYLGGIYLRYLPASFVIGRAQRADNSLRLWSYVHPYDFDADEPLFRMRGANWPVSFLLWMRRAGSLERLGKLFGPEGAFTAAPPLGERIPAPETLSVYTP